MGLHTSPASHEEFLLLKKTGSKIILWGFALNTSSLQGLRNIFMDHWKMKEKSELEEPIRKRLRFFSNTWQILYP